MLRASLASVASLCLRQVCSAHACVCYGLKITRLIGQKIGWTDEGQDVLKKLKLVSEKMAKHAHDIGSCDNITVTILLLLRSSLDTPNELDDSSDEDNSYANVGSVGKFPCDLPSHPSARTEPPIALNLDARRNIATAPLSPGALTSEILSAMNDTGKLGETVNATRGDKGHSAGTEGTQGVDQDDDIMSYLLDDSNF